MKTLHPDEALYHTGDPVHALWRLVSGVLILRQYTADGKAQVIDILGPGEYVDMKLRGVRNHEAIAVTPCQVKALQYSDLQADQQAEFLDLALERLGFLQEHSVILGRGYAEDRVRSALEYLAGKSTASGKPMCEPIELPAEFVLSRQLMADFCGLTLETVSRIFSGWFKTGVAEMQPNQGMTLNFHS